MNRSQRRKVLKNLDEKDFVKIMRAKVYIELLEQAESHEEPVYFAIEVTGRDGEKKSLYIANQLLVDKLKEANE